ncbi:MAG: hypothetical protein DYG90_00745 [Chloroflexi bacterium CFX6]|nr:hypothetical protein [Chloroflexi bacterium CFX6]
MLLDDGFVSVHELARRPDPPRREHTWRAGERRPDERARLGKVGFQRIRPLLLGVGAHPFDERSRFGRCPCVLRCSQ